MTVTSTQASDPPAAVAQAGSAPAAGRAPASESGAAFRAAWSLCRRELTRFLRQRSRLIGALATPVLFWFLFGAGLHDSFQSPGWAAGGLSYREYFLPGIAALILMFTAIFSAMSIIEDRHEGFLQGVLAAPVPRWSLVLGKVGGGTIMAVVQALLFVILGLGLASVGIGGEARMNPGVAGLAGLILYMSLVAAGLTAMGFLLAWKLDSIQGFHAIMNVFLMPMWLLSGAFFPVAQSGLLAWIMRLNPLTYGVAGIRRLLYLGSDQVTFNSSADAGMPSLSLCIGVSVLWGGLCFVGAVWQSRQTFAPIRPSRRQAASRH